MSCQACSGVDRIFGSAAARRERKKYARRGPRKTTQLLIEGLAETDVRGSTLLEIGGGIGVVQAELFRRGLARAVSVDASGPFVEAAREVAREQAYADRVEHRTADFVEASDDLGDADLVALDRVVCCYPDAVRLVTLSADRARRRYGLVYPVDRWWNRVLFTLPNLYSWITRNPFRAFVHADEAVDGTVKARGFRRIRHHRAGMWQVAVYERPAGDSSAASRT